MVNRIRELCKQNGTSIKKLEVELGFGNGVIARWSKSKPNYERLSKVAERFGVSVSYLLGEDDEYERMVNNLQLFADEKEEPNTNGVELSEMEEKLLSLFRRVPADRQPFIIASIESALQISGLSAGDDN